MECVLLLECVLLQGVAHGNDAAGVQSVKDDVEAEGGGVGGTGRGGWG
jgi:hypothetical protein